MDEISQKEFDKKYSTILSGLKSALYITFKELTQPQCIVDNNYEIRWELKDAIIDILYKQHLEKLIENALNTKER